MSKDKCPKIEIKMAESWQALPNLHSDGVHYILHSRTKKILKPGETAEIPTGVKFKFNDVCKHRYAAYITHGSEACVSCQWNVTPRLHAKNGDELYVQITCTADNNIELLPGQAVAVMVICKLPRVQLVAAAPS